MRSSATDGGRGRARRKRAERDQGREREFVFFFSFFGRAAKSVGAWQRHKEPRLSIRLGSTPPWHADAIAGFVRTGPCAPPGGPRRKTGAEVRWIATRATDGPPRWCVPLEKIGEKSGKTVSVFLHLFFFPVLSCRRCGVFGKRLHDNTWRCLTACKADCSLGTGRCFLKPNT